MKKKDYTYIGISFIILLFGIIFIPKIVNRLSNNEVVDNDRHNLVRNNNKTIDTLAVIGKAPSFELTNQNEATITDSSYSGKVYLAEFFFTTCPSICPIMNRNMVKIQNEFEGNPNLGIASFSIFPDYDTPEILKAYADKYEVTNPNWHFLTGDQEEILKLSNEGFKLYAAKTEDPEELFAHSGFFALIDQDGNIRSRIDENGNPIIYYDGLEDASILQLIEDIKKLL